MRSRRAIKNDLFEQVARVSKALANPKRLELLALLIQAPKSVDDLAKGTEMSVKLASAHLKELRSSHLVDASRDGKRIIYRISNEDVSSLWVAIREVAEAHLAELQATLAALGNSAVVWRDDDRAALVRKVATGKMVLLDVRPADEFAHGHLPNARSLPHDELKARLAELPKGRPIVAYCRGPFCQYAADAVKLLRKHGFDASELRIGVAEWDRRPPHGADRNIAAIR